MSEWDKKRNMMQRYDSTAHIYDMRYAEEQTAKIEAVMESINMEKESLVLDAGCGTGLLFNYVANKAKEIVGLDISRKTLLRAKKSRKAFKNVYLILADVDNMPLKDDVFSHVFALTLIQNMPSPLKTLNEIKRITKENAVIIVTGLKKKFSLGIFEGLLQNARLNIVGITCKSLKCYVAVCSKYLPSNPK